MKEETYTPNKIQYGKKFYFGNYQGEEYFITPVKWDCGWYWGGVYIEGLRPTNEETLKRRAADSEISDFYNVDDIPSKYIDNKQFASDMEDEWENHADIQETQDRNGEKVLLTFGCHTHTDSVLLKECKGDYKTALEKFDKLLLTEEQFNKLIDILKRFYKIKDTPRGKQYLKDMAKAEAILKELEDFSNNFKTFPTEEYWIETDEY